MTNDVVVAEAFHGAHAGSDGKLRSLVRVDGNPVDVLRHSDELSAFVNEYPDDGA